MIKNPLLLLGAAGLLLLASCKPSPPPKVTATDTGKSGPGAQTIKGGNVTFMLSAEGKPLSYTIGNSTNLLFPDNFGPGFYLTTGTGAEEKTIPFVSSESKDGNLILTAEDKTRVTIAVNAGDRFISFRLENIENAPDGTQPVLNFRTSFQRGHFPEMVPLDYIVGTDGNAGTVRLYAHATWPLYWKRGADDPKGGIAFFIRRNDEEHNEALLRIWTEDNLPHPKVEGEWTYERAKQWVQDWNKNADDTTHLVISAEKPEDLDPLIEYAKELKAKRVYLHTDTWRGEYMPKTIETLSVNTKVFPRGEADLKAFIDKLKANGIGAMMHTLGYGFGNEGSKYMGKGKKTDRRIATWGKGKLEKSISAKDTTILFRPDPGVTFPDPRKPQPWPKGYPAHFDPSEILIGDEIIRCNFNDTDKPVWTLTHCNRSASAANHEAGIEVMGILKAYNQNYYPSSMTDLPEITAKEYADFFDRLGVQHHEFDGAECHNDVPWGFSKWAKFVYQNTKLPATSNTSSGLSNPWDLMYRFRKNGADKILNKGSNHGSASGTAVMMLESPTRLATGPLENHYTLGVGAANNTPGYVFGKPEPMFGIFPNVIHDHGLAELLAGQFATWREITSKLTPEMRKQILDGYAPDRKPPKIVHEARRAGDGFELQPFTILTRGAVNADWGAAQEHGCILPRQYVGAGMRVKLDNPFGRQAPQFILRVMNGYTDNAAAAAQHAAPVEEVSKDMQGYLAASGVQVDAAVPAPAATPTPAATPAAADPFRLQPKAAVMTNTGNFVFADVGPALEVSFDNSEKPAPTPAPDAPVPAPNARPVPKPGSAEYFNDSQLPSFPFNGNSQNARGLALTVTGDGSGAFLVIQLGRWKDYVIPIDFTGRKEIFIPLGEAAHTVARWGMRFNSKGAKYGPFGHVAIGFGRVPANTKAKVLIEDLRMVGEKPSSIKNPVIHAGTGTLAIQGEVKSGEYLWYQGGGKVGHYDKNWKLLGEFPAVATDYEVDKGFSEYWIDGECPDPAPWFDLQFITKGETVKVP